MILIRILLLPFSWLYYLITQARNKLYDRGIKPSVAFEVPVICVGNLTVGGTGKTPMIEYLVRLLQASCSVATLSRGYGRKTRGFRIAGDSDNAETIGDEPYQFYLKFGDKVMVAVGEERALAIPTILQEQAEVNVVLLDDGFQHRRVRPGFSILLSDYSRPFYKDLLLPAGRLRESRWNAGRAQAIVVTKCPPGISDQEMLEVEHRIRMYAEKPVFFSSIRYGTPISFTGSAENAPSKEVVLISGLANPKPLESYVAENYTLVDHLIFKDHHKYTKADIDAIVTKARKSPSVSFITTEKDRVKLDTPAFREMLEHVPFFYLPIEIDFIKGGKDFDEMILNAVNGEH